MRVSERRRKKQKNWKKFDFSRRFSRETGLNINRAPFFLRFRYFFISSRLGIVRFTAASSVFFADYSDDVVKPLPIFPVVFPRRFQRDRVRANLR